MKFDELSKRCKKYEKKVNGKTFTAGLPLLARLDGRAFHTFTRGLTRPFDMRMVECMRETTKFLVSEFKADLGYTQSDEITLFWNTNEESGLFFDGKSFKLNSVMAATCSVFFNKMVVEILPEKADQMPIFDCRTWQVPNLYEAALVFLWREKDATRNSLNSLAQSVFSHKQLQNKSAKELHIMLESKDIKWDDLDIGLRRGFYYSKIYEESELDLSQREDIPEKHRIKKMVMRSKIIEKKQDILKISQDIEGILFGEL